MKNYEKVYSCKANGKIPVHKYKDNDTGITIVLADIEGPLVNGYFCLATEAHDDDGLPHTLEHLIFLGSESYPYKGMLDILANRCLASGTNAWTDVDHTVYTLTTAGSEGFLTMLPIYVDHILYPLLEESGYITEVHHVNGEGEDAGVVYCEMQGRENTGESRVQRTMLQAMYPGDCGYKAETGGILKNLRESTSIEKVRQYHKSFYRPENLTLVITGKVQLEKVIEALRPIQEKILSKSSSDPFQRPWQNPVPPLVGTVDQLVPYACEDEDHGLVHIAWRGPSSVYQLYEICGLMMLMEYLTDTAASPLQKAFCEITEPFASKVHYSFMENSESTVYLIFENVPVAKLGDIKPKLFEELEPLGDASKARENFDMKRMELVINRRILEQLSHLENSPHDSIAFMIIGDVLYGHSNEDLRRRLNQVDEYRALQRENASFWSSLVKRYLLDKPFVYTQGIPSKAEMEAMMAEEESRIKLQRESLGTQGLTARENLLEESMMNNEKEPPSESITSVPIPSIDSISYHPIERYSNRGTGTQHPKVQFSDIPFTFRMDSVQTNFVYLFALMDTAAVPKHLRLYLPLLMESLLELPILKDGKLIPYEEVVAQLAGDTVKSVSSLGVDISDCKKRFFCGPFCQVASVILQVEREKYVNGVTWLYDILFHTVLDPERMRVIAAKMASDVAQVKRNGNKMSMALIRQLVFDDNSNHHAASPIRQQNFLNKLAESLRETKTDTILSDLNQLRDLITSKLTVHVASDLDSLEDVLSPWKQMFIPKLQNSAADSVTADYRLLTVQYESCALSLGSVESSYMAVTVPSIHDYDHPDLAAVLVALQYLCQLEGPLWRQVRGQGLAYGYNLNLKLNEGLLYLTFYRASQLVAAFKEATRIIEIHLNGVDIWETNLLDSAKSSLVFELVEREKTVGDVVLQSVLSYLKDVPHDYSRNLIRKVASTQMEDVRKAAKTYLTPLLKNQKSHCAVVCHPSKLDEIVNGLQALGQRLTPCTSAENSPLGK